MASHLKIADNEMNYFQYKAQQMLLLKKEDYEWQNFCKQIAPECAACLAEKTNSKESKDIGIQAFPKKSINKIERAAFESKCQKEQIPEALDNIKARLEKIDFALSKIYDVSYENEEKKPIVASALHNEKALKSFEKERKLLIQNSLKSSLQKLQYASFRMPKKSQLTVKPKIPGYFLPHDLQVKRAAARKAYLVSLQAKPKVSFKNMSQNNEKNAQTSQSRKNVSKPPSKSKLKKKKIPKKSSKELNLDNEETLIASTEAEEGKDEIIEHVVDGILEDLLGEAGLDLNKIKQRKGGIESNILKHEAEIVKTKETTTCVYSLTSPEKNTEPKVLTNDDNSILRKELTDKSKSTLPIENPKTIFDEIIAEKGEIDYFHKIQRISEFNDLPKFICDVSNIITVDSRNAKNISEGKERFWKYLENISRTVKGNFNPWILNEMLAESILDECINDIAEELSEMPSNVIQDLYNQEFVQQVEKSC